MDLSKVNDHEREEVLEARIAALEEIIKLALACETNEAGWREDAKALLASDKLPTSPEEWASRIENYWILKDCERRDGKSPFDLLVDDIYRIQRQARATLSVATR